VQFFLKARGNVDLRIYDILGREVRTLASARMQAGTYRVVWDGKTSLGSAAATGVYFYRLIVNDYVATKKMILLK
jgi:flagellar hook assembly protein FlgD